MPLEAFTDKQLADLKYSEDGGLGPEQQAAVDEELHDRAVEAGEKVGPGVPTEGDTEDDTEEEPATDMVEDPFSDAATLWQTPDGAREPVTATNEASTADDILLDDARMFEQAESNGAAPEPVSVGPSNVIQEESAGVADQPVMDDIVMQDAPALQEPILEEEFAGFDEIQTAPSSAADSALIESAASDQGTGEYYPDLG
jgi:hypothetical protein